MGNVFISLKCVLNIIAFVGPTSASMLKGQKQEDGTCILTVSVSNSNRHDTVRT